MQAVFVQECRIIPQGAKDALVMVIGGSFAVVSLIVKHLDADRELVLDKNLIEIEYLSIAIIISIRPDYSIGILELSGICARVYDAGRTPSSTKDRICSPRDIDPADVVSIPGNVAGKIIPRIICSR